jgi:M-phase inducer tyrosine phosphatase
VAARCLLWPRSIKRVSNETVARLLRGEYKAHFDRFLVIDARYDYEFAGGHITGAVNINSRKQLTGFYSEHASACPTVNDANGGSAHEHAHTPVPQSIAEALAPVTSMRTAVIFHCEFSKNRGPKTCAFFRQIDRSANEQHYPFLSFPELAVMDGGYKQFFEVRAPHIRHSTTPHATCAHSHARNCTGTRSACTLVVPYSGRNALTGMSAVLMC